MEILKLSSQVRDGVTLPICIIIVLSAFLRLFLSKIFNSNEPGGTKTQSLENVTKQQILNRAQLLHQNGHLLSLDMFLLKRAALAKPGVGLLTQIEAPANPLESLLSSHDSTALFDMMKTQVLSLVLSAGVGYLISSLFSGFLVAKAPFPLPYKFKAILQKGIDVPNLEMTYVSSLSWYFFVLISSSSLIMLINHYCGDDTSEDDMLTASLNMMVPTMMFNKPGAQQQTGLPTDMVKAYKAEQDTLNSMIYSSSLDINNLVQVLLS